MVRTCSNCGASTPPEARFCRHCGAALKPGAAFSDNETISPLAQTVPLSSEGLTTSGLGTDETGRPAPETKRVERAEIERLLRRTRLEVTPDSKKDGDGVAANDSDYAAPPTGELVQESRAPVVVSAPAATGVRAPSGTRPRRSRTLLTGLLILAALSGAVLAYYFLRQRTTESASSTPPLASNSNQTTEQETTPPIETTNANSSAGEAVAGEAKPQGEEAPTAPTPKPSASVEPTARDTRAKQEREREGETPVLTATPTPATASSPVAKASPTPSASTHAANGSNNATKQASQATSDSFYFQAVNIVNGREPRILTSAELLRALQLFQNVKSGAHVAEARRQAERLGRELDRLNKQPRR